MIRFILSLIMMTMLVMSISAQRDTIEGSPLTIENPTEDIVLNHEPETSTITLTLNGIQPDGCDYPIIAEAEINENRIDVRFVRIPDEDVDTSRCTRNLVPVQETVTINYDPQILSVSSTLLIAVNNDLLVEARISLLPTFGDEESLIINFDALIPIERVTLPINSIELRPALEGSPFGSIIIRGNKTTCEANIEETQSLNSKLLSIEVYQAVDPASECTQQSEPFEMTIPIRQPVSGATTVNVNGVQVEHGFRVLQTTGTDGDIIDIRPIERPTAMPLNTEDQPLNIGQLVVEIDNNNGEMPRLFVTVSGEHPDGCDFPLRADVTQDGDTINVELMREVNVAMMCTMILQAYEHTFDLGEFESGTYQLVINGISVEVTL